MLKAKKPPPCVVVKVNFFIALCAADWYHYMTLIFALVIFINLSSHGEILEISVIINADRIHFDIHWVILSLSVGYSS